MPFRLLTILGSAILLLSCAAPPKGAVQTASPTALTSDRPNIIVIIADDLGYGDVSAFGGKVLTPNIDRIARDGVRLTDAHATGTVCSPSRAAIMTGRYQARFGHDVNPVAVSPEEAGLPLGETTIAERMRKAGYRTGLVGKWHLGGQRGFNPVDRGFDEFFGFNAAARYIVKPQPGDLLVDIADSEERAGQARRLLRGHDPVEDDGFLTEILTREALDFLDRNQSDPFFLVVTHYDNHVPLQAPAKYVDRVVGVSDPGERVYAAMTLALDDAVGAVIDKVNALGLSRRTLIVFMSDNGCPAYLNGLCSNAPWSGHKRDLREGGHRIAMMARWPGVVPAGTVYDAPVLTIDISATALTLAGLDSVRDSRIDGKNILPQLTGKSSDAPHDLLFWRAGANYAVRDGAWKLLVAETPDGTPATFLFNLVTDRGETKNLALSRPDVTSRLTSAYEIWNAKNQAPRFVPRKIEVEIAGAKVLMSY